MPLVIPAYLSMAFPKQNFTQYQSNSHSDTSSLSLHVQSRYRTCSGRQGQARLSHTLPTLTLPTSSSVLDRLQPSNAPLYVLAYSWLRVSMSTATLADIPIVSTFLVHLACQVVEYFFLMTCPAMPDGVEHVQGHWSAPILDGAGSFDTITNSLTERLKRTGWIVTKSFLDKNWLT